jgi:hypothetical protein
LHLICTTVSVSEERLDERYELVGIALELLQAEGPDMVSLDQHVHFLTPETTDIVVSPSSVNRLWRRLPI